MIETKQNTFGDYEFEEWVPEHTRELIREFWGQAGRTYDDWLRNGCVGIRGTSYHGPNPDGFGNPPYGATAIYFIREPRTIVYKQVRGRYIHRWNNMGSIIDENGESHIVSSCDCWVRVFTSENEKMIELS